MKSSTRTEINVGAGVLARAPLPSHYSLREPLSPTEIDVGAGVLARAQLPSRYSLRHPLSPTEIDVGSARPRPCSATFALFFPPPILPLLWFPNSRPHPALASSAPPQPAPRPQSFPLRISSPHAPASSLRSKSLQKDWPRSYPRSPEPSRAQARTSTFCQDEYSRSPPCPTH